MSESSTKPARKPRSPKHSRRKGQSFEREVAGHLRPLFPDARRGLSQTRGGAEVADVEGTPFWVECKHRDKPNVLGAMEQAERDEAAWRAANPTAPRQPPLVVVRKTGEPIIAAMRLDDLMELLRRAYAPREEL